MAKKQKETEGKNIQAVEGALTSTEQFIEKNQKLLMYVVAAIIIVILGFMGFKKYYLAPLEEEAQQQMFMAETYFNKDSLDLALMGDGNYLGFIDIIDEYGMTNSANLAHYYAGIAYLKRGEYETAIEYLEDFSSDDLILSTMATGAIGDAHIELGDIEEGVNYYSKAANNEANRFTTPIFLMKAGLAYEKLGDFAKAAEQYETIKKEYPNSQEAQEIEKFIARAKGSMGA